MRKTLTMLVVAVAITASGWTAAQQGHESEKLTGTIKSVDTRTLTLQVVTADKKTVEFLVNGNTKIASGDVAASLDEIKPGTRVIVTMQHGKTPKVAVAIELPDLKL